MNKTAKKTAAKRKAIKAANKNLFPDVIGQDKVKNILNLYISAHGKGQAIPPILFSASMGKGKTMLAEEFARNLTLEDGKTPREFRIISCAGVQTKTDLTLIWDHSINDREVTILFDECHALGAQAMDLLLNLVNPRRDQGTNKVEVQIKGEVYPLECDFKKQTIMFATTDAQNLSLPLKNRLEEINLQDYSLDQLAQIVKLSLKEYKVKPTSGALKQVATVLRGNARTATLMARRMNLFCKAFDIEDFDNDACDLMFEQLDILPLGVKPNELKVMRAVAEGAKTLQVLSSILQLSRQAVQKDVEPFLTANGLMNIDGKRESTKMGEKYLLELDKK